MRERHRKAVNYIVYARIWRIRIVRAVNGWAYFGALESKELRIHRLNFQFEVDVHP